MTRTIKLFFLFILIAVFSSCSTVKAKKETAILKPASLSFIELAPFFPKDTNTVGRFQIDKLTERWFPLFSEQTSDPEINALMKKRNQRFRAILRKESIALFGMDISTAKELVFALSPQGAVLAVQGSGKGIVQQPTSKITSKLVHVRVIGNTILFYPKSIAESLIQTEGLSVSKLKSIPGNMPIVVHLLNPSFVKKKPFSDFKSANLSVAASGLVRLRVHGDSESLDKTQLMFNLVRERMEEKIIEQIEFKSPSVRFFAETFFESVISTRITPETMEFKALLPKILSDASSPATIGVAAAIAIPAFQKYIKYIKRSKAAEVAGIFARVMSALSSKERCTGPPLPPASSEIPVGGVKTMASFEDPTWAAFGMKGSQEMYFSYRAEYVNSHTLKFIAETNFTGNSESNHTESFEVFFKQSDKNSGCEIHVSRPVVLNAFQ